MVEPFLQYIDQRPHLREEKQPPLIELSAWMIITKVGLQKKANESKKINQIGKDCIQSLNIETFAGRLKEFLWDGIIPLF